MHLVIAKAPLAEKPSEKSLGLAKWLSSMQIFGFAKRILKAPNVTFSFRVVLVTMDLVDIG